MELDSGINGARALREHPNPIQGKGATMAKFLKIVDQKIPKKRRSRGKKYKNNRLKEEAGTLAESSSKSHAKGPLTGRTPRRLVKSSQQKRSRSEKKNQTRNVAQSSPQDKCSSENIDSNEETGDRPKTSPGKLDQSNPQERYTDEDKTLLESPTISQENGPSFAVRLDQNSGEGIPSTSVDELRLELQILQEQFKAMDTLRNALIIQAAMLERELKRNQQVIELREDLLERLEDVYKSMRLTTFLPSGRF